jgi:hypothetical protein
VTSRGCNPRLTEPKEAFLELQFKCPHAAHGDVLSYASCLGRLQDSLSAFSVSKSVSEIVTQDAEGSRDGVGRSFTGVTGVHQTYKCLIMRYLYVRFRPSPPSLSAYAQEAVNFAGPNLQRNLQRFSLSPTNRCAHGVSTPAARMRGQTGSPPVLLRANASKLAPLNWPALPKFACLYSSAALSFSIQHDCSIVGMGSGPFTL